MPRTYADRIARVPGVAELTWTVWLPGFYQDPKNGVLVITIDPVSFFRVRHEIQTSPEHLQALLDTPAGILVSPRQAEALGWKIGDRITLQTPMARRDGTSSWTFDIVGFWENPSNPNGPQYALANYSYLDAARAYERGTVTRFVVRVADARRSVDVGRAIDALFVNSPAPTRTQSENEIAQIALATIGDVNRMTTSVVAAVFFAILFLTANVLAQSARERKSEFAVLKTLGFGAGSVLALVFAEGLILCTVAAAAGLGVAAFAYPTLSSYLPALSAWIFVSNLSAGVVLTGLLYAAVLALVSAAWPAWQAMRLEVADALRAHA